MTVINESELLAGKLNLSAKNIKTAIELLDEGNTVPFIARYRKDRTGGIDDEQLRE
ncbi:MAG: Tex-like N-terminal domain-containing protein, partial [Candidatus Dojkabacteria bacterium]